MQNEESHQDKVESTEEKAVETPRRPSAKKESAGDKYLAAALKSCNWIEDSYKEFAENYQDKPVELREIYMCACDGVPLELMMVAEKKEPIVDSFRLIRRKHIEALMQRKYADDLEEIRCISKELEQDVKDIVGMVRSMAEYVPFFDEMFPEMLSNRTAGGVDRLQNRKTEEGLDGKTPIRQEVVVEKGQGALKGIKERMEHLFPKKKDSSRFIKKLYTAGYNSEQIDFVLDCLDEGLTEQEIKHFIAPVFPIDLMKRLKELERR